MDAQLDIHYPTALIRCTTFKKGVLYFWGHWETGLSRYDRRSALSLADEVGCDRGVTGDAVYRDDHGEARRFLAPGACCLGQTWTTDAGRKASFTPLGGGTQAHPGRMGHYHGEGRTVCLDRASLQVWYLECQGISKRILSRTAGCRLDHSCSRDMVRQWISL